MTLPPTSPFLLRPLRSLRRLVNRTRSFARRRFTVPADRLDDLLRDFRQLQALADGAIAQCPGGEFFALPAPGDNSIAIIVKHVAGNLHSRWTDLFTSDGEKPGRDRDAEFEIRPGDTREHLLAVWAQGWSVLYATLGSLTEADLGRPVRIRGETLTVLQAATRQLMHYAYHTGQIVYVAKHFRGPAWRTLSIPRGGSAAFNARPDPYLRPR